MTAPSVAHAQMSEILMQIVGVEKNLTRELGIVRQRSEALGQMRQRVDTIVDVLSSNSQKRQEVEFFLHESERQIMQKLLALRYSSVYCPDTNAPGMRDSELRSIIEEKYGSLKLDDLSVTQSQLSEYLIACDTNAEQLSQELRSLQRAIAEIENQSHISAEEDPNIVGDKIMDCLNVLGSMRRDVDKVRTELHVLQGAQWTLMSLEKALADVECTLAGKLVSVNVQKRLHDSLWSAMSDVSAVVTDLRERVENHESESAVLELSSANISRSNESRQALQQYLEQYERLVSAECEQSTAVTQESQQVVELRSEIQEQQEICLQLRLQLSTVCWESSISRANSLRNDTIALLERIQTDFGTLSDE